MKVLNNLPPKGTADWFPEEFKIRKYIFDVFRDVCQSFGYEEYLTPTFEKSDIYKAKSGEDIGGKELMILKNKKIDREFALRPEMTPSATRMISRIYEQSQKPIRYFSIANFFRNEKPQRGRNREFWQLNYDIFGTNSIYADIEIIKIAVEIMLRFIPEEKRESKPFITYINDRRIITSLIEKKLGIKKNVVPILRTLDKKSKISQEEFHKTLKEYELDESQISLINKFMEDDIDINSLDEYIDEEDTKDIKKVFEELAGTKYAQWIKFRPNLVRGFDYYTGIVYEVFDNNQDNRRSLFGGGRYNGLGELFGKTDIPAVGCAPGDECIRLFLESWDLLNNIPNKSTSYYIPIIDLDSRKFLDTLAEDLRQKEFRVQQGLERESLSKALEFANKKRIDKVIIMGEKEIKDKKYIEKDMKDGTQIVRNL
jgi:histidyl-tRNA synthetase